MNPKPFSTIVTRSPQNCSTEELSEFKRFVLAGGEVNPDTLPTLISHALSLVFAKSGESLVAVGAVKRPNVGYRARVFEKAKAEQDPKRFEFELGWVYIHENARGRRLASTLVEKLVQSLNGASAYATSRVDNERMHASLKRFGFKPVGTSYPSQLNEPAIQLFICE